MFGKSEGLAFLGENGTLLLTRGGWEVIHEMTNSGRRFPYCYPCDEKSSTPSPRMESVEFRKSEGKGLYRHVGNMLECIKTRNMPNADIAIGSTVAKMCHIGNISCRLGRALKWNDSSSSFVQDREANALTKAYYREPWRLPKV